MQTDSDVGNLHGAPAPCASIAFSADHHRPGIPMPRFRTLLCTAVTAVLLSTGGGCSGAPLAPAERAASASLVAKMNASASTGALLADSAQATQADLVQPCSNSEPAQEQTCRGGGMIGGGW